MSDHPQALQSKTNTNENELLRTHWDDIARDMPDLLSAASTQYYRQMEIALIQRHVGELQGKKVLKLDLWNEAVNTRILNWMAEKGAWTCGLDISHQTARRAEHNSHNHMRKPRFLLAEIRDIPFPDNTFDFVYTMGTIEHIDDQDASLREIKRVLKVGRKAIVGVPHKWDLFLRPLFVSVLTLIGKYLYAPEKSMSAPELQRAVERSGLKVITRTGLLFMPGILRMVDLFCCTRGIPFYRITPLLLWPFEQLERRYAFARKLGYLLALVVEKPAN
jgi:ubiquinone/menaquinone biosynthesis C-methylase UbiE